MRIAYLSRKDSHPTLNGYAEVMDAVTYCDDSVNTSILKQLCYSIKLLFSFKYKSFDGIISNGPLPIAVLLKKLSFGRLKLINTQASAVILYDYFENRLSKRYSILLKYLTNNYDLHICTGEIQFDLTKRMLNKNSKSIVAESINGVSRERFEKLEKVNFNPSSNIVIGLSNLPSKSHVYVKGFDVMLKVFSEASQAFPNLEYYHIGSTNPEVIEDLMKENPDFNWDKIHLVGRQSDLNKWFDQAIAMLHLSRLDAFPVAVTEAFAAGIPTFISENVGVKKMYTNVLEGRDFLVDEKNALSKLKLYLNRSNEEKKKISKSFLEVSKEYTAEEAEKKYSSLVLSNLNNQLS